MTDPEPVEPIYDAEPVEPRLARRDACNIVSDTVTGVNIRPRDNLIQTLAIAVCLLVGVAIGASDVSRPLPGCGRRRICRAARGPVWQRPFSDDLSLPAAHPGEARLMAGVTGQSFKGESAEPHPASNLIMRGMPCLFFS